MEISDYIYQLKKHKNIILNGPPGTGKSWLARAIAANMIGIDDLELDTSNQFEFVQFHPSYDYTDFVEGLRPATNKDGQMGFELKSGVFYQFCTKAKEGVIKSDVPSDFTLEGFENYLNKTGKHHSYHNHIRQLLGIDKYTGKKDYQFKKYETLNDILNDKDNIRQTDNENQFRNWYSSTVTHLQDYYELTLERNGLTPQNPDKNYVFVIDEINRGEISKIFGELFFSIDPGYRGKRGSVLTQYSNLHAEGEEKFYIPENVYIIGTMNDIDRSVDTFDFAMRRRFAFIEVTAEESEKIVYDAEVRKRMSQLNEAISDKGIGGLSKDYQIGGSYFMDCQNETDQLVELWNSRLRPLLKEYFRGHQRENEILDELENVFLEEVDNDR